MRRHCSSRLLCSPWAASLWLAECKVYKNIKICVVKREKDDYGYTESKIISDLVFYIYTELKEFKTTVFNL